MKWHQLYSPRRTGDKPDKKDNYDGVRTSYIRDYDRLIFSSAFRRLQNKTQVFPLPGAVFVHNRLTHSLEVASVGRSLGKAAGDAIADKYRNEKDGFEDFYRHELPSVIAAACLAHDIGNPPFGHSGEDAIRAFFTSLPDKEKNILREHLSPNQLRDFELFEGNANAFRILTHAYNEQEAGGYRLTYATLASIVKYPCTSEKGFNKAHISTKKSGFFDSEETIFYDIADQLGMVKREEGIYARHPFVYLTEAADDICYRVIDMEDAHRLRIISLQTFMDLFLPFFDGGQGHMSVDYVKGKLSRITDDNQKVQYLRAVWIGLMTQKLATIFVEKEEALLNGILEKGLLDLLDGADTEHIKLIDKHSVKYVYQNRSVLEIEIAGFNIIGGLLREFIHAVLHPKEARSKNLLLLVPQQYHINPTEASLYHNIQSVVDYISGMTDLYAIDLYRKITGISIPEIR